MNSQLALTEAAFYSETRIKGTKVSREFFVTTDSMLQNKGGITDTQVLPKGNLISFSQGDILVGNIRPYLKKIWYSKNSGGCSPDVLVLKSKPGIDSKFLYYSLFRDDFFSHMMKGSKGTKMPRGDKNQILRFHIPKFNFTTQQKIASVLSALDSKIELNNRINAELEAMAKTLYDYWFVQFDFPDTNGKPYKTSGGKMVWNEELKREIPEGWEVNTLSSLCIVISRGISPKYIETGGICVLNQKCIRNNKIEFNLSRRHDNKSKDASYRRIKLYDVLVNSTGVGTLGRVAVVKRIPEDFITIDSHVTIVRSNKKLIDELYFGFTIVQKQKEIEGFSLGSTGQVELSRSQLESINVVVSNAEIQKQFRLFYFSSLQRMSVCEIENQKLTELRDWLLPMLMNGQVRPTQP